MIKSNHIPILRALHRNGSHKCIYKAGKELHDLGLARITDVSGSGLTCIVVPTDKTSDALLMRIK